MPQKYMSEPNQIRELINEITGECARHQQRFDLRELLFCIRDIPYGRPTHARDPQSVVTDWRGTCSGKHALAQHALQLLGYDSRLYCIAYRIDDALPCLPQEIIDRYAHQGIWDVHNCLELLLANRPALVDVTWPRHLKAAGFTTTLQWDGVSDFEIAAPPGDRILVRNAAALSETKESLLSRLNAAEATANREQYIVELAAFAARHSDYATRAHGISSTLADIRHNSPGAGTEVHP